MRFNVSRFPGCPSRQMGLWTDLSAARRLSSLMKMLIVRPKTVTGFKNHEGNMREHGGNMAEMLEHDGNMRGTCGEHAGNMRGTWGDMLGASRGHVWNMWGAWGEHA